MHDAGFINHFRVLLAGDDVIGDGDEFHTGGIEQLSVLVITVLGIYRFDEEGAVFASVDRFQAEAEASPVLRQRFVHQLVEGDLKEMQLEGERIEIYVLVRLRHIGKGVGIRLPTELVGIDVVERPEELVAKLLGVEGYRAGGGNGSMLKVAVNAPFPLT